MGAAPVAGAAPILWGEKDGSSPRCEGCPPKIADLFSFDSLILGVLLSKMGV